jgi:hypothetical protein
MISRTVFIGGFLACSFFLSAQSAIQAKTENASDSLSKSIAGLPTTDSTPTVSFRDVNIVYFRTDEERMLYYKYKSRIQKVLPYVKIAKQLYTEIKSEKENSKRREYRHYRKDVEKEMRTKFENELKNLSTSQGEMLFKLINRETKNNAYTLIKEIKGGFTAWFYQMVGKRWGYDLKENYDPEKEKLIEMIIKEMGPAYNVQS